MKFKNIIKKIDFQLVPPHDFIKESAIQRLRYKYLRGLFQKRIGNIIPIVWFFLTFIFQFIFSPIYFFSNKFFKYKIIKIDLSQIGSLLWLSSLISNESKKRKGFKYIVCLPYIFNYQNSHIFNYLSKEQFSDLIFVKNLFLRFIFSSMSWNRFSSVSTTKYEFDKDNFFSKYKKQISKSIFFNIDKPIYDNELNDVRLKFLEKYQNKTLITFNLRNQKFYDENRISERNVDSSQYFDLIRFLVKNKFSICFTHDPGQGLLENLKINNFEYELFDKRDKAGQFANLLSLICCNYLIGSSTGASVIPLMNNIPVYWTNIHTPFWIPLKKNDLVLWKKFKYPNGNLLTMKEYLNEKLEDDYIKQKFITLNKIKIINNTSEELLNGFKYFLSIQKINKKNLANKEFDQNLISKHPILKKLNWSKYSEARFFREFG